VAGRVASFDDIWGESLMQISTILGLILLVAILLV
jgi:hypothetical protein